MPNIPNSQRLCCVYAVSRYQTIHISRHERFTHAVSTGQVVYIRLRQESDGGIRDHLRAGDNIRWSTKQLNQVMKVIEHKWTGNDESMMEGTDKHGLFVFRLEYLGVEYVSDTTLRAKHAHYRNATTHPIDAN